MRKKKSNISLFLLVSLLIFSCLLNGLFGYYFFSLRKQKDFPIQEVVTGDTTAVQGASAQTQGIKMPCKKMKNPLVLVVGCINYQIKDKEDLPGTKIELERIIRLFKEVYGYKVVSTYVKDKPETWAQSKRSIMNRCKVWQGYLKENRDEHDGVIFVYSGHGLSHTILASDGRQISLGKIRAIFNLEGLPEMVGMPKVFLFSKCRGPSVVEAIRIGGGLHHPEEDFLEIYGNVDDYQIKDNPPDGAFLIHEFADWLTNVSVLRKLGLTGFLKIVNNNVQHTSKHTELVVQHVKAGYNIILEPNDRHKDNDSSN